MTRLGDLASYIRSKNAGPFWLTVDIFFDDPAAYATACRSLDSRRAAARLGADPERLKRFDIDDLSVIKISVPRPRVQGAIDDRDMHGAAWAILLADLELDGDG